MAETTWWIPLLSGAMGVAGALGGTWVTQSSTRKREQVAWRRTTERQDQEWLRQRAEKLQEVRSQLYVDVMEYAENLTDRLVEFELPHHEHRPMPDVRHPGQLRARLLLYASEDVLAAWRKAEDAEAAVRSEWDETEVDPSTAAEARERLKDLQSVLQRAVRD